MNRYDALNQIRDLALNYLKQEGLELVDISLHYEGRNPVLKILVDRPQGGINIEECAFINEEISAILEPDDLLQERYILEVSSPGLDRPLKTKKDFLRCLNRRARFFLSQPVNAKVEIEGLIRGVTDNAVQVATGNGTIEIPLANIRMAKQIVAI